MPPPGGTTSRTTISPCSRRQSWLADSPTGLACADAPATTNRRTSSTQRFMRTEPSRKNERARDRLLVTSAFLSQSRTGAQGGKAKTQWVTLVLLLGLTAVATGQPLTPAWPKFLVSRDAFPPTWSRPASTGGASPPFRGPAQGQPPGPPSNPNLPFLERPD